MKDFSNPTNPVRNLSMLWPSEHALLKTFAYNEALFRIILSRLLFAFASPSPPSDIGSFYDFRGISRFHSQYGFGFAETFAGNRTAAIGLQLPS
jgi:hypothetical protein